VNRIKQLRLAKGLSLDALAQDMGGLVTKQALSKYEKDRSKPSATVTNRLAAALGVKAVQLWYAPTVSVEFVAYRRLSRLGKKEQARIQAVVGKALEERCCLQERLGLTSSFDWVNKKRQVCRPDEAETVAAEIRKKWSLGSDSIADLTGILEDRLVHVLELDAEREFDGISAVARNEKGAVMAGAVTTRRAISGDRQRMNLAHELGHLVLEPTSGCDEEDAAFRFAGAFLVPAETLRREIGSQRVNIQFGELLALKRRFGTSIQALLRRMLDLEIVSESAYKCWQIEISKQGWRKQEPEPLPSEKPGWLNRMLLRALAEGIVTVAETENMSVSVPSELAASLPVNRAAFLRLPMEQRRRMLETQADQMRKHYEESGDMHDLETGEIRDHDST
jgi:Zn-dependent peptidase ImmA (M78 family)/transcriptional regulator with XRE-family HTH domain